MPRPPARLPATDTPLDRQVDSAQFEKIYLTYFDQVYHFILIRLQDPYDAEDLTQEVFLRAWLNLSRYQDRGIPYIHYLLRIASNLVVDYFRRFGTFVPLKDDDILDTSPEPEEAALLSIDIYNMSQFLDKLPQDYQTILILRYITGLSIDDIARIISRSQSATRSLQHRALMAARSIPR